MHTPPTCRPNRKGLRTAQPLDKARTAGRCGFGGEHAASTSQTIGNTNMRSKKPETTSSRVATKASKLLSNPKTPATVKSVAASALTQKVKAKGK